MRGKHITVADLEWDPYFIVDNDKTGNDRYKGYDVELLKLVAAQLNFTYTIVEIKWNATIDNWENVLYQAAQRYDLVMSYWTSDAVGSRSCLAAPLQYAIFNLESQAKLLELQNSWFKQFSCPILVNMGTGGESAESLSAENLTGLFLVNGFMIALTLLTYIAYDTHEHMVHEQTEEQYKTRL